MPRPDRAADVPWLEPYPDVLLDCLADTEPNSEARYGPQESVSLAFITALQVMTPHQRAVLILRDVLGFPAAETAEIMQMSPEQVESVLGPARTTTQDRIARCAHRPAAPAPGSAAEQGLVRQLTHAYAVKDADSVVSLLTDDVVITMPPDACEYRGRQLAAQALGVLFDSGRTYRLIATRANGQPAFGLYVRDPRAGVLRADGLLVITLAGEKICALSRFGNGSIARFGLPRILPE
jgi:RNA polymerase sigma-70 factor (ECF subfamily)